MASEYLTKLAKEQKPRTEEKLEMTGKEKRQNWWFYHKWYVIAGIAALVFVLAFVGDVFLNREPEADYWVAYIGSKNLPEETRTALSESLAELGEDLNGDGQVVVQIRDYLLFADDTALYQYAMAAQVQLSTDLSANESFIFLMDDPRTFQEQYELLTYPDGTLPGDTVSEELWYGWSDCPVLTGLELGTYEDLYTGETRDSQELLSGMSIARRGYSDESEVEYLPAWQALWESLLEGAK